VGSLLLIGGGIVTLQLKKYIVALLAVGFTASVIIVGLVERDRARPEKRAVVHADEVTRRCITCHDEKHVAAEMTVQWTQSRHAEKGVGCMSCHEAKAGDSDRWEHEGFVVTHVPSPRDCLACHEKEAEEFLQSHHAKAAQFIGSLDNMLGEITEGGPAANLGCKQCHGSVVQLDAKGVPLPGSWPNTGIGRVNPDGSFGSCSACHTRHMFSKAQAREPRTCGRCHMGPDHPQIEIFEESKHGIMFAAFRDQMNLRKRTWVLGTDYSAAPTCTTCHMSATTTLPVTHDIGERISWTLRPVISKRLEHADDRRARMVSVCSNCHSKTWVANYFVMFDEAVGLYNTKFAAPAQQIMDELRKVGKITPTPFDDKIEWTFYELWHHEGRRARMGASMMGPDFTQWHGFYEVAKHFYNNLIPEAESLMPGVSHAALAMPEHAWRRGMKQEEIAEMLKFYSDRYGGALQ
jgi:hydroxylamine dehydrogenase